jgi:hypothetical protein
LLNNTAISFLSVFSIFIQNKFLNIFDIVMYISANKVNKVRTRDANEERVSSFSQLASSDFLYVSRDAADSRLLKSLITLIQQQQSLK